MTELSPAQKEHWRRILEDAERQVELAKQMLGNKAVEQIVEVK